MTKLLDVDDQRTNEEGKKDVTNEGKDEELRRKGRLNDG